MLRTLSTGSSVIAALMAADRQTRSAVSIRPDLLEFLLVRSMAVQEPHRGGRSEPAAEAPSVAIEQRIAPP